MFGVIAANIVNAAQLESLELDSVISTPLLGPHFQRRGGRTTSRLESGSWPFRGSFTVSSLSEADSR